MIFKEMAHQYIDIDKKPNELKDILKHIYQDSGASKTYSYRDKACTEVVPRSKGTERSLDSLYEIATVYFPKLTHEKFFENLVTTGRYGIQACEDVCKITVGYSSSYGYSFNTYSEEHTDWYQSQVDLYNIDDSDTE